MRQLGDIRSETPLQSSLPSAPTTNIHGLAQSRLQRSAYSVLRRVHCECDGDTLRLRGCLPSQYLKQVAQAAVAEIQGVRAIINEIEVVRPAAPGEAAERFAEAG
jgi:hypothetical protein